MGDSKLDVVEQGIYCQEYLQKVFSAVVENLSLQVLQNLLPQRQQDLVYSDVVNLKVHYRGDRDLSVVWAAWIIAGIHTKPIVADNLPRVFDNAASGPETEGAAEKGGLPDKVSILQLPGGEDDQPLQSCSASWPSRTCSRGLSRGVQSSSRCMTAYESQCIG